VIDLEVAVVGGGPAGATCARHLAHADVEVAILEKNPPPRYKTCGGGLVPRARRLLAANLESAVESECRVVEMNLLDAGLSFRLERPQPLVSMTMRSTLDRLLVEKARNAGARLITPCRITALRRNTDTVILETDRGPVQARYLIAADGAASPIAKAAGWPVNSRIIPALESEIRVGERDLARFAGSARFDFGFLPHGYAWVFPKKAHLSIGCLSTRRGTRDLKAWLDRYLLRLGLGSPLARKDHGFIIPMAPRPGGLMRQRVLLIGDAAGLADPISAEGISHAAMSGRFAAEAIARHLDDRQAVQRNYERALDRDVLTELRLARLLAPIVYNYPRVRRTVMHRVGTVLCELMGDLFCGKRTYRSLLLRPRNYLKLAARFVFPAPP
jgi:geranylgeranyl reductase family protein